MRSIVLLSIFLSVSAMACPDLSGSYSICRASFGNGEYDSSNIEINQSLVNGATVFNFGGYSIIADGKEKVTVEDAYTTKEKSYCEGQKLITVINEDWGSFMAEGVIITVKQEKKVIRTGPRKVTWSTGEVRTSNDATYICE